jgi:hypothetical protein
MSLMTLSDDDSREFVRRYRRSFAARRAIADCDFRSTGKPL